MVDENGAAPEGVYVLQVRAHADSTRDGETRPTWQDVVEVTVPARTKRKTAIRKAIEQAGIDVTEDVKVRLLDAESAEVRTVRPKPPAPAELDIV